MEEKPFKALATSSMKSNPQDDIRSLWTTATLSQPKLNVQLSNVYRDSELEGSSVGSKTRGWYNQKAGHDSDGGWEEWDDRDDNVSFKQEEPDDHTLLGLELHPGSSFGSHLEEEDDPSTQIEIISSMPSLSVLKHTSHGAYWAEQQTRLPLPLIELMENEALEILTKARQSYRSGIGRNHFLTKQLQRYIEGLKRRRNKRLNVSEY
ncbi:PREDICTED: testis-expressed sequence 40 protein isoform X1 [Hipposideros armiger]|uniref:Testis-expressed sequence 40 protein isoform X1 n=1 Tax=Hipposideros armiger TaxID=186990 RepID=A0A8B7RIW3_HIPAR|nr:PREDICTED: testis-expressed sequence 40 protein isoform X1 [Hipposideros armiger]